MIWNILASVVICSFLVYLYYLQLFTRGLEKGRDLINYHKPFVSIVVAARNEETNIQRLMTALLNQNYPLELYEIIVANDGSTDATEENVKLFAEKWKNVKLINVTGRDKAVSPKKNALSQAISRAQGEIIMSTDADCLVSQHWIEAMLANFEQADMVLGFSRTRLADWQKASLAQKFEYFDFAVMFFAAGGAIAAERYFSCSGQNIAYRQSEFNEIGGFRQIDHLISGDDLNLMQLFRKAGKQIRFCFSPRSYVYTQPVKNWIELLNQRSRWASNMKWQLGLNPEFFLYLACTFFSVILPFILIFHYWLLAVLIILFRIIFETAFIKKGLKKFLEENQRLKFYPFWFFLQPVYFIIVALMGAFDLFNWKKSN